VARFGPCLFPLIRGTEWEPGLLCAMYIYIYVCLYIHISLSLSLSEGQGVLHKCFTSSITCSVDLVRERSRWFTSIIDVCCVGVRP